MQGMSHMVEAASVFAQPVNDGSDPAFLNTCAARLFGRILRLPVIKSEVFAITDSKGCHNPHKYVRHFKLIGYARHHVCDSSSELFCIGHMQKFVWSMGIAFGAKYAAHHHLCFRKAFAQHIHEWNRATLADGAARGAKIVV